MNAKLGGHKMILVTQNKESPTQNINNKQRITTVTTLELAVAKAKFDDGR